jgi:hypothetical protein
MKDLLKLNIKKKQKEYADQRFKELARGYSKCRFSSKIIYADF